MDQVAADAQHLGVGADRDVDRPVLVALLRGVGEMLAPVLDPFDRTLEQLRRRHHGDVFRIDAELRTKAAADFRRDDAQLRLVHVEQRGDRLEQVVGLLGGRPGRDAFGAAVVFGDDAAPFDRMAGAAVLPEIGMEHMRGLGEGGVGIAEIHLVGGDGVGVELAPHRRRAGRDRLAAVRDRGQQVVVDVDQRGGVLGDVAAVGDDDGDRLAHIGHLAVGEREAPHAVERRAGIGVPHHAALGHHGGEVVEGEHGVHARQRQRGVLRRRRGSPHADAGCARSRHAARPARRCRR